MREVYRIKLTQGSIPTYSSFRRKVTKSLTFFQLLIRFSLFIDFNDKKVKEEGAEEFAKYLALSQKNLNQLKQRFIGKSIF